MRQFSRTLAQVALAVLIPLSTTSTLSTLVAHVALSTVYWLSRESEQRDVYIRGIRGDLWDWLFIWKERRSFALIINILIQEFRSLSEAERKRIIDKYDQEG